MIERFPASEIQSLVEAAPRYDLAESVGPSLRLGELLGTAGIDEVELAYGTAPGNAQLRGLIAQAYGVDADDVVITVGGMHALFLLAFTLCGREDEAVTTSPLFPLARNVLEAVGAKVRMLELSFDAGYRPDVGQLAGLLSGRTTLVTLASPQNPSGVAIRASVLQEMLAVMDRKCPQARLLVDETYRDATYGDDAAPSAIHLDPRVISIASLSKCHGAAGLRIGWVITRDAGLREQLVRGKFNTVISCSVVDEALAVELMQQRDPILSQRRRHFAMGLRTTERWLEQNSEYVEWVRPDAGALCCVRLKPSRFDDAAVKRFYDASGNAGVRVASGAWFGEHARVFRLGFGLLAIHQLESALDALSGVLGQVSRSRQ